jgi:hypothetical protein
MNFQLRATEIRQYLSFCAAVFLLSVVPGCKTNVLEPLQPKDFLHTPKFIDPGKNFGHLRTVTATVPASSDIFLANSVDGTEIEFLEQNQKDVSPTNSPIIVLDGIISGGETIDIFATGEARHEPVPSINYGPSGWENIVIEVGPLLGYDSIEGVIGSLVGMFSNQNKPFVIGRRKQVQVPRGAKWLYLAVLDFPGASSNNQGEYVVTIDVIRR